MIITTLQDVECFLNQYAKSKGFVVVKGQIEKDKTDKSIIIRRTFECHHEKTHKSKKVVDLMQQRNRQSEKIDCPWICNINRIKKTDSVKITTVA